jgi:hypothetical protein
MRCPIQHAVGIMQEEEITLGYFVKVISVHPIITAAHVHNREKEWRSADTLGRKTQEILSLVLLVLVVFASLNYLCYRCSLRDQVLRFCFFSKWTAIL